MLNSINQILGLQIEEHYESIEVDSRRLREIFLKLNSIIKYTAYSKVFKLEVNSGILTLETSTILQYKAILKTGLTISNISGVFLYQDIADMLNIDTKTLLIVASNILKLENGNFEVTFLGSPAEVDVNIIKEGDKILWPQALSENIAILKNINTYGAIFKKVNKYEIEKNWVKVCYPSLYVGQFIKDLEINVIIDNASMSVWLLFVNQPINCTILQGEYYLTYISELEQLTLYVTKPNGDTDIRALFLDSLRIGKYCVSNLNKNIAIMAKNYPNAQLKFLLFTNGIQIVLEESGVFYKISDGRCDNLESSFKINLKVCHILSKIWGNYLIFYRKGDRICLQGNLLLVLSVTN